MNRKIYILIFLFLNFHSPVQSQHLPDQMHFSIDGKRLITGNLPYSGFYDQSMLHDMSLTFLQSDYWDQLEDNYDDYIDIIATLVVDGITYDSVGVRFKGATSYTGSNDDKKSFNVTIDAFKPDQNIDGYNILNLNNCYNDPSFMGEVLYESQLSKHLPAPKGNLAHLTINGMEWGIYANVQQVNRDLVKEWFPSKNGALWRAKKPEGSPAPTGVRGDSLRTLYYLTSDTMQYFNNYQLKSAGDIPNPNYRLMNICRVMDSVSQSNMENILGDYLDIDRALWFLAGENIFDDDDSYILKGRSDYYIYYEIETGRLSTIEMDGNDVFDPVNFDMSIFKNANKPNFALLYKLLNNPPLRQRYLAHMRTFVHDALDSADVFPRIDYFKNMIDAIVQIDPVQNYSYAEFINHIGVLKNYILDRRDFILDDSEIDVSAPSISNTTYYRDSIAWKRPDANQDVWVTSQIASSSGINKVSLYSGTNITGKFSKTLMMDDGMHHDMIAGDGIYGAKINGKPGGTWVRFYIEATSNNSAKTVSYDPPGAEHDIYAYLVLPSHASDTSVVINELMAKNVSTVTDSAGEYADWIELYNNSSLPKDISGYYLTDDSLNLIKWQIPQGTIMPAHDFLIVWADDNKEEGLYHTNFKFDGSGDELYLINSNLELVDKIIFGPQSDDLGYARVPNGTGSFVIQQPTFDFNNNPVPLAAFTATTPTIGCAPLLVSFHNASSGATSYLWNFGDGSTSTFTSPLHTYITPGNYTVTLTASNSGFSDSDSLINMITVNGATPFQFATDTIYTTGINYTLSADSGYTIYQWSTNENSQTIIIDTGGQYCVEVTSANSCSDFDCVFVVFNTTGIDDLPIKESYILYPNPADDHIILVSDGDKQMQSEIYNSIGKLIYKADFFKTISISTKEWTEGIYFIRTGNYSNAFIISHEQ